MDTRTGKIVRAGEIPPEEREHFVEMLLGPTAKQARLGRVGRNDPCPCGSGKKFKKCCLRRPSKGETDARTSERQL